MALFTKSKPSPTLLKLKQLFEAEKEERLMRTAVRWTPVFRQALDAYEKPLEDVQKSYQTIFSATARSNRVLWQFAIAVPKRLERESRGMIAPDRLERLYMVCPHEYVTALHEVGLKQADGYLAALYSLAKSSEGVSEEAAQERADTASARVTALLAELAGWDDKEVTMRSVTLQDGRKTVSPFFSFAPDILAGDVPTLIDWARQHPEAVS